MILARLNFIATTGLFVVVMLAQAAAEPCRMWDVTGGWHSIQGNYFGVRIGINWFNEVEGGGHFKGIARHSDGDRDHSKALPEI
jgi:hypothetical protein